MKPQNQEPGVPLRPSGLNWLKIFIIVVLASLTSTLIAVLILKSLLFPDRFQPVELTPREERELAAKLADLTPGAEAPVLGEGLPSTEKGDALVPEPYQESAAARVVILTERELNALLASNTDLADRLVIDLAENLASAKLLIPLDEGFPLLGGQTLRASAGLELAYADGRPVVILKGVSLWGVPLPNAWLGNLKNIDLVQEFGGQPGFWQAFAAGIQEIEIDEGRLRVRLKE